MTTKVRTIKFTAKEASTLEYLLMKEERQLGRQRLATQQGGFPYSVTLEQISREEAEEEAALIVIRQKIHAQI